MRRRRCCWHSTIGPDIRRADWTCDSRPPRTGVLRPLALLGANASGCNIVYSLQTRKAKEEHLPPGTFLRYIGTGVAGAAKNQFKNPIGVAVLPGETVAVADYGNHRVVILKIDGSVE